MTRAIGSKRRAALMRDLLGAEHDVISLANRHKLRAEDLSAFAGEARNQRVLTGLCKLADLQTQLLLSRYRLIAASRLIRLATIDTESEGKPDVARRACVDLLRLDLKRADLDASASVDAGDGPSALMLAELDRVAERLVSDDFEELPEDSLEGGDDWLADED